MISLMAFCTDLQEFLMVRDASKINAAVVSNDNWIMDFFNKIEDVKNKIKENPLLDIICFELAKDEGISYAKYLRKCYEKAYMIVMADMNMSPKEYIRPDIMPAGLILQPASESDIRSVIKEVFEAYIDNCNRHKNKDADAFVISTSSGIINIPYNQISYFEARNKKIYIRYTDKEVGFYSTMDKIEAELEYRFVRTHRSFMVNKEYIRRIRLSSNEVVLKDKQRVPLSRRYKPSLKELVV